jgi:DNA-binding CsgD family transcriptional regulator
VQGDEPGGKDDAFLLLVSQTGSWVLPSVRKPVAVDARQGWNARGSLARGLALRTGEALARVWQAIERATRDRTSTAVVTERTSGQTAPMLLVRPAREPGYAVITRERVDAPPPVLPAEVLTALFGLTPMEATVAGALMQGAELSDIAASRGISTETVRGHVKSLLRKTGTGSQKQLAAMLSRLAMLAVREDVNAA